MPIAESDILYRLSGGAANANPNASLGGAKSSEEIASAALHNLFDVVSGQQSLDGSIEYRCFYVHNAHATLTMLNAVAYMDDVTPSPDTAAAIAVGSSAVNGTEQTVVNEATAPTGVTFVTGVGTGNSVALGNIPPGQHRAVWVRRTVTAGASAFNNDGVTVAVLCETEA